MVTHSVEELLTTANTKFGIQAKRVFTTNGGEVDDVKLIKDEDILYVSSGEPFIKHNDSNTTNKDNSV
jgi:BTB/POZ domain-containing protein KCTD9